MISGERVATYSRAALALAALLTAAFPVALAAGAYLSEAGIIGAFEGEKVTARCWHGVHGLLLGIRFAGRAGGSALGGL